MNNLVEAALSYAAKGYFVFPCKPKSKEPATKHGFKDATRDEESIRRWWTENPNYNVAIATGKESGLWVLDVDGQEGRESYLKYQSDIPYNTPNVKTPSGGFHLYFVYDEQVERLRNSVKSIPGLDVRTEGGYVVAAGSVLDTGEYEYLNSWREPTQAPERLVRDILTASERGGLKASVEATIVAGSRNSTLFRRARSLFAQGYDYNEVHALLDVLNHHRCNPPLELSELLQIVMSAEKYERGTMHMSNDDGVGVLMSDVTAEKIQWLWGGRIPLGKLTMLDGDPSLGKSVITVDLAARVTNGWKFPDGDVDHVGNLDHLDHVDHLGDVGGVVILSAEDGLADTIRPRLDAAGADVSKVVALSTVNDDKGAERQVYIPEDIPEIERAIQRVSAKLVIVDPVMAFLSPTVNSNYDQQVRQALTPLKEMAERTGVAVLLVRHLSKQEGRKSLYRGGGSIGIIGAARSALVVEEHPDNKDIRVLAMNKANLAHKAGSLTYSIITAENNTARIAWGSTTYLDADDILNPDTSRVEEAMAWLATELKDMPLPANTVLEDAKQKGISKKTLYRAKDALRVESKKDGLGGVGDGIQSKMVKIAKMVKVANIAKRT